MLPCQYRWDIKPDDESQEVARCRLAEQVTGYGVQVTRAVCLGCNQERGQAATIVHTAVSNLLCDGRPADVIKRIFLGRDRLWAVRTLIRLGMKRDRILNLMVVGVGNGWDKQEALEIADSEGLLDGD